MHSRGKKIYENQGIVKRDVSMPAQISDVRNKTTDLFYTWDLDPI